MPRILVVDDQTDVRAMISMILRLNRFEVTEADGVKAGLRNSRRPISPPPWSTSSSRTRTVLT